MGAEVKTWNAMEIAEQACQDFASQNILSSALTIDPLLPVPQTKHRIVLVFLILSCFLVLIHMAHTLVLLVLYG